MSKSYLDMTNEELLNEIHRVEKLMPNYQNRKYLQHLHKEWGKRKHGR